MPHNEHLVRTDHQFVDGLGHDPGPDPGVFRLDGAPGPVEAHIVTQLDHCLVPAPAQSQVQGRLGLLAQFRQVPAVRRHPDTDGGADPVAAFDFPDPVQHLELLADGVRQPFPAHTHHKHVFRVFLEVPVDFLHPAPDGLGHVHDQAGPLVFVEAFHGIVVVVELDIGHHRPFFLIPFFLPFPVRDIRQVQGQPRILLRIVGDLDPPDQHLVDPIPDLDLLVRVPEPQGGKIVVRRRQHLFKRRGQRHLHRDEFVEQPVPPLEMALFVENPDADGDPLGRIIVGPFNIPDHRGHGMVEPGFPEPVAPEGQIIDQQHRNEPDGRTDGQVHRNPVDHQDGPQQGHPDAHGLPQVPA